MCVIYRVRILVRIYRDSEVVVDRWAEIPVIAASSVPEPYAFRSRFRD